MDYKKSLVALLILLIIALILSLVHISNIPDEETEAIPQTIAVETETAPPEETSGYSDHIQSTDWKLILVNQWHPLPAGFSVELTELMNNQSIDTRAYPDLQQMMDDCRAAGLSPVICSSYRTQEKQQLLFDKEVARLVADGYSQTTAEAKAGTMTALPGTSEHQLGLALDIIDADYQTLDDGQESTAVQQWLIAHSWEYGFILRYPNGKSDITGIIYEPWHYRYVGKENAKKIHEQNLCLEEYLNQIQQ